MTARSYHTRSCVANIESTLALFLSSELKPSARSVRNSEFFSAVILHILKGLVAFLRRRLLFQGFKPSWEIRLMWRLKFCRLSVVFRPEFGKSAVITWALHRERTSLLHQQIQSRYSSRDIGLQLEAKKLKQRSRSMSTGVVTSPNNGVF